MIVLGTDPGTRNLGYALLGAHASHRECLDLGVVKTSETLPIDARLERIFGALSALGDVDLIAWEDQHAAQVGNIARGTTSANALWVREVCGMLRGMALSRRIPYAVVTPAAIRSGVGLPRDATKEQVAGVLLRTLRAGRLIGAAENHATDALGVAVVAERRSRIDAARRRHMPRTSWLASTPARRQRQPRQVALVAAVAAAAAAAVDRWRAPLR